MPIDIKGSAGVCGVQYEPGTFDDPAWTNPGRCDRECAFFERKRFEHFARKGQVPPPEPKADAVSAVPNSHGAGQHGQAPSAEGSAHGSTQNEHRTSPPKPRARMRGRKRAEPVFGAPPKAFLSGKQRRKIMDAAEKFERRTKRKGKQNGMLGQTGLQVLRAFLFKFHSAQGQTYPSYTALQSETGLCRQTIAECIERLERHGFLRVINRIRRAVCRILGVLRIVQTSNAYEILLPPDLDETQGQDAPHRSFPLQRDVRRPFWDATEDLFRRIGVPIREYSESG